MTELSAKTNEVAGSGLAANPSGARHLSINWQWIIVGVCIAFTMYIALIPLGFLLWQSFFTPQTATQPAVFTLGNYITAYTDSETVRLFLNSLKFAIGVSTFSFLIGTALAWMNERTNTPF